MFAERMAQERREPATPRGELQYARKTYRYLRIALVSMVVLILASVAIEWVAAGELLGSLSAYYYTPVHSVFIGALVLIGICLVAIRGASDPEDVALNIAGLCAPIVAFVPTGFPGDEETYTRLIEDNLPISDFALNNVLALAATGLFAIALAFGLGAKIGHVGVSSRFTPATIAGFVLAAVTAGVLVVVYFVWGLQEVHGAAAVGLIGGLWFVATANGVRNLQNQAGKRPWSYHVDVGLSGSAFLFGLALAVAGLLRWIFDGSAVPFVVGAVIVAAVTLFRRSSVATFLRPPKAHLARFDRSYLTVASTMAVLAPAIAAWPEGFEHRTFWIELAELLPFAAFWVLQTIEYWNATVPGSEDTAGL